MCVCVCVCVCVSVCLSVTTLAAASFISTLEIRYEQLYYGILLILKVWIFKKCFVQKLWLTVTVSDAIAATFSSFFGRQRLLKLFQRLTVG